MGAIKDGLAMADPAFGKGTSARSPDHLTIFWEQRLHDPPQKIPVIQQKGRKAGRTRISCLREMRAWSASPLSLGGFSPWNSVSMHSMAATVSMRATQPRSSAASTARASCGSSGMCTIVRPTAVIAPSAPWHKSFPSN